jgi:hypothetical protein
VTAFIIISTFGNFLQKLKILKLLKITKSFDDRVLRDFKVKINFKTQIKIRSKILRSILFGFLLNFSVGGIMNEIHPQVEIKSENFFKAVPFILNTFGMLSYCGMFLAVVSLVRVRINVLNDLVENFMMKMIQEKKGKSKLKFIK